MILMEVIRIRKRQITFSIIIIGLIIWALSAYFRMEYQQQIIAMSRILKDRIIVIDPGHGGVDPGAVGCNGTLEKDITLQLSKRLAFALSQAGAMVILTREGDYDLSDADVNGLLAKKRQDLKRRVELANDRKADIYVSIHLNSYPSKKLKGAQTFYQKGQAGGKQLAEAVQAELCRVVNTNRVAKGMDFYTNRSTKMPSVTIEVGFISNPVEEKLLVDSKYQNRLVWAIFSGIVKYFNK